MVNWACGPLNLLTKVMYLTSESLGVQWSGGKVFKTSVRYKGVDLLGGVVGGGKTVALDT